MTAHSWILLLLIYMAAKWSGAVPFQAQIDQAIAYTLPFAPWIILSVILARGAGAAVGSVFSWIDKIFQLIAAIIYGIAFTVFVVPVMIADTMLLGPIAMWAWKHTSMLILSVVANGFVYWFLTKTPVAIPKKYVVVAIVISVSGIFALYGSQWLLNTNWLAFKAQNGTFLSDPAASIEVKGGDTIRFTAFGYNTVRTRYPNPGGGHTLVDEIYPPEGLVDERYVDPTDPQGWPRPDGEVQLLVEQPNRPATVIRLRSLESGPGQIFGISFKDITGGYYISGVAEIPKGVGKGRLGIEFFNISPIEGEFKMTVVHNLGASPLGRFTEAFVLGEGRKALTKKDFEVGVWWLTWLVVGFTIVGLGMVFGYSKEGLVPHIPDIVITVVFVFVVWYIVDWLSFTGRGGPFTLIKNVWGWIKS